MGQWIVGHVLSVDLWVKRHMLSVGQLVVGESCDPLISHRNIPDLGPYSLQAEVQGWFKSFWSLTFLIRQLKNRLAFKVQIIVLHHPKPSSWQFFHPMRIQFFFSEAKCSCTTTSTSFWLFKCPDCRNWAIHNNIWCWPRWISDDCHIHRGRYPRSMNIEWYIFLLILVDYRRSMSIRIGDR